MSKAHSDPLTPQLRKFVRSKVRSGTYRDEGEVIREGLRLLQQRELASHELRGMIEEGWLASERGLLSDGESFMDELEAAANEPIRRRRAG